MARQRSVAEISNPTLEIGGVDRVATRANPAGARRRLGRVRIGAALIFAVQSPGVVGAVGVVGAFAALGASGCASSGSAKGKSATATADKHYEVALGSFHNGMIEDAKVQLKHALDAAPEHAESLYLSGLIALKEGNDMIGSLEQDICLVDASAEIQRERVDELHRKAFEFFKRASKSFQPDDPGRGRALNSMAVVSLYFHDYDAAVEQSREALTVQFYPERYSALANLGWAYYGKGDLIQAMTELRQSVMMNPDYCVGRYRLGQVYFDYQLDSQALDELQVLVDSGRCPIQDAYRLHGEVRSRLGLSQEAEESYEQCVTLAPRSCLAQSCRSLASGQGASSPARTAQRD